MKLVIVKHENCGQKFLFQVPEKQYVYAGNLVLVKNKKGETLATCLCDGFTVDENSDTYKSILSAFGASEPLATVVGRYYFDRWEDESEGSGENSKNTE